MKFLKFKTNQINYDIQLSLMERIKKNIYQIEKLKEIPIDKNIEMILNHLRQENNKLEKKLQDIRAKL